MSSRYEKAASVGASGLQRLSLHQQVDSDGEMVETRSQAKKGESSSRSKDKGKGKAKEESSRRKSRKTSSKAGRKRPSDDDSSDDDDSDDSGGGEEAGLNRAWWVIHLRLAMSVLNADDLLPTEFMEQAMERPGSKTLPFRR